MTYAKQIYKLWKLAQKLKCKNTDIANISGLSDPTVKAFLDKLPESSGNLETAEKIKSAIEKYIADIKRNMKGLA